MKVTARGIAAGVAGALTLGAFSLLATAQQNDDDAQERARQLRERQQQQTQQQQTQRSGSADAAWDRVADLHRQIVQMEISQQGGTTTQPGQQDRSENRSTNQPDRDTPIIRDRSGNQPGQTATDRTSRASAGESRSDALWDQLAQKHAQLVQAKLKGESDEGAAGQQSRRQPTQPAQPAQPGQPGQRAQPAQPAQPGRPDVAGSQTERLEREIGQLYMQILAVDMAEARGTRRALRPDLDQRDPSDRPDTPRTPDRKIDDDN